MKKIIFLVLVIGLIPNFLIIAYADNTYNEEYFSESLFSKLDSSTVDALDELGIDSLDVNDIYNVSFSEIINYFSEDLKSKFSCCIADASLFLCMILIASTVCTLLDSRNSENIFSLITTIFITIVVVQKINPLINMLLTAMKTNGDFMLIYIPIFTLLIALSGNPSAGITYNTLTLIITEGISLFVNSFATGLIGLFFSLSVSFSVNPSINLNKFVNSVNRIVGLVLGFLAGVFSAILSIKGIMSVSIDSVSVKGIRFLLSSLIPIVGSAISDAYSSLVGSINLIKGSVALVGILVSLIISLPAISEGLFYCIAFSFLSDVADSLNCGSISSTFKIFYSGLRILLLLSVFEIFILVISTGIMLSLRGGI